MDNKFVVTNCRFHTKDDNTLLIQGWFEKNDIGETKVLVCFDKKKVNFRLEEIRITGVPVVTPDNFVISKRYCIWIRMPKGWSNAKSMQILNFNDGVGKKVFEISVVKLLKQQKKMSKFIEDGELTGDGYSVSGWCVSGADKKIQVFDEQGNEQKITVEHVKREDVIALFPENSEDEILGFKAVHVGSVPKKVRVHLETAGKTDDFEVTLRPSVMDKGMKKMSKYTDKIVSYYTQFGVKKTFRRVWEKVTRPDRVSYRVWYSDHKATQEKLAEQREAVFDYMPKISIVVPLYKTPEKYLDEMVKSVQNQSYSNWELCLSDGSGENSSLTGKLKQYEKSDSRIKVVYGTHSMHISENTNEALKTATGDFIAFGDHDDILEPNAFYECVNAMNEDRTIDVLYTDEDKVSMNGKKHFMPHFKSDFNLDMLCSVNYICHLFMVRRDIFERVGMLNPEFDGAQDYDFVLRSVEIAKNIKHVPQILYSWRSHKNSTAENPESKRYAFEAGMRAVQAHYDRIGLKAKVSETSWNGIYRTRILLQSQPLVSIIIPNMDHTDDLDKCIQAIEQRATYKNVEYIIIENNSTKKETFDYYEKLQQENKKAKVVFWEGKEFNYSAINNYGVSHASGEYFLLLNNDTEIISKHCIEELLGYCMRPEVGAVGARLFYADDTIQHAGVLLGLGGIAGHPFVGYKKSDPGYFGRIVMSQDCTAVTAACMMVKKSVFEEVSGLNEELAVAFNDVDFCLRIRSAGYLIVYNPYATLHHYESKSRGYEDTDEKVKRFHSEMLKFSTTWAKELADGDPYYNPNLSLSRTDYMLKNK
ncbi:glycosyltransferase family 2 protein [Hespellia stercorisuis]|uniref:Glycosyltransferase, GT2 family n=1 Tax=Hespellia stercorisuis DSM 15480 TaxID=1121950 RepID=A0A1M6Q5X5_9FIRM|nr:glycosyltransferase family 2 protein [Hespellia stercorisuis]SHK15612.1 Glycosyltransferase, GT2 family [Hespellia stercorisuis DSM 15480]